MVDAVNGELGRLFAGQADVTLYGISNARTAGKTGTAQNGDAPDHGWFIGYARTNSGQPVVAVAVLIQNAGSGGSAEATAIAGDVMQAAIAAKGLS